MNLIDQIEQSKSEQLQQAKADYAALLERADSPDKGDGKLLTSVLATLGLTVCDFEADASALKKLPQLEAEIPPQADIDTLDAARTAAQQVVNDLAERVRLMEREALERRNDAVNKWRNLKTKADNTHKSIAELKSAHPRVWTPPPAPATEQPTTAAAPAPNKLCQEIKMVKTPFGMRIDAEAAGAAGGIPDGINFPFMGLNH